MIKICIFTKYVDDFRNGINYYKITNSDCTISGKTLTFNISLTQGSFINILIQTTVGYYGVAVVNLASKSFIIGIDNSITFEQTQLYNSGAKIIASENIVKVVKGYYIR